MYIRSPKGLSLVVVLIIGLIVGIMIAGIAAFVYSLQSSDEKATPTEENKGIILSIESPDDGSVISSESVSITGSTGKNSVVVVTGGQEDVIAQTQNADFKVNVSLREGDNPLTVYAFDTSTGESSQTSVNLLYLKDELGYAGTLVAQENTVDDLKEKLSTQSSELKKTATTFKRTFVLGTISSTSDTTLTVETEDHNVKTVFTDDFTEYLSIDDKSKSALDLEDFKAGDKIAVVGLDKEDTNGLGKFVVRLGTTISKSHALIGEVNEVDGNAVTLSSLSFEDEEFSLTLAEEANVEIKGREESGSINDIKVGDTVIAVGTINENGSMTVTSVYIDPTTQSSESSESATPSSSQ